MKRRNFIVALSGLSMAAIAPVALAVDGGHDAVLERLLRYMRSNGVAEGFCRQLQMGFDAHYACTGYDLPEHELQGRLIQIVSDMKQANAHKK